MSASDFLKTEAPSLEAFLLGCIRFDHALTLQQRLVEQAKDRDDGQVTLLLCEHPPIVTIGRSGSPADVAMQSTLVRTGQLEVQWVNRGGGSQVHCPGQLAVYPIVPLRWHGFSIGRFLQRFQTAILESLADLNIPCHASDQPEPYAIHGRTGQVASLGIAVRHWTTYFGAYLNVCPPTGLLRLIRTGPAGKTHPSSLVAERCGPVKMTAMRAALIGRLTERFGCDRYHLYTGHPMLRTRTVLQADDC